MKSLRDVKEYYRNGLAGELHRFEHQRRSLQVRILVTFAALVTIVICLHLWVLRPLDLFPFIIVAGFLALIIGIGISVMMVSRFKRQFKTEIIGRLVHFMEEGLEYAPRKHITAQAFERCRLFETQRHNIFRGEDLVWGKVGNLELQFSELYVAHRSGGKNSSTTIIFRGLFLVADAGRTFRGTTVVLPATSPLQLPEGRLGEFVKSLVDKFVPKPTGQLLELDDPAFSSHFTAHADDEEEGRELLDETMRQRILALGSECDQKIRVAFSDNNVYVALPTKRNMFEPKLLKTVLNYELVEAFFQDFSRACELAVAVRPSPVTDTGSPEWP